jgi:predicted SprT family Zn-dependent metalloprotease
VLETIFHELNRDHFAGELPLPALAWNPRLRTTAGRFSPGSRNPLLRREPRIEVASYLRELADGAMHIRDTVLHEMIHYFLWHKRRPYGHTEEFYTIMKRVGAKRYNPVPKLAPVKYWYVCASCRVRVPARRRLGQVACASCCEKFNQGNFSARYLLQIWSGTGERSPEPEPTLSPEEIIRRLEEIKSSILARTR